MKEIKEEDPISYEQEEEIEEISKDPKTNTGDTSSLPIVYYDTSGIDEIFKENKQTADEKIKVSGDYKLINKDKMTYLYDKEGKKLSGKRELSGKSYYFDKDKGLVKESEVIADGGRFAANSSGELTLVELSLIHISEPTRREWLSRMPSSA